MHRVRLDRGPAPAQAEAGVRPEAQRLRDRSAAQHVGRGDQGFSSDLAMLAEPGSHVHRVAEIRDLPLCDAALGPRTRPPITRRNSKTAPTNSEAEKAMPTIRGSSSASQRCDTGNGHSTNWRPTATIVRAAVIVSALITNSALSANRRKTPPSRDRGTAAKVR